MQLDRRAMAPLVLDRERPYEQIVRVWTLVVDRQEMPYLPSSLREWAAEAIAAISTLPIPEEKRHHARSMLIWLYFLDFLDGPDPLASQTGHSS
jgi:hypothetical protein